MQPSTYRADIDGLRAVAVIAVVLFHLDLGFPGGYVGVDVFFVISGYLITGIIQRELAAGSFSLRSFYLRRVRRILPALAAMMVASSAAAYLILLPSDLERYGRSVIAALLSLANLWFWSEGGYFGGASEMSPLLHTWSLAVEEQFYLLLPWGLLATHRFRGNRATALLGLVAVATFAASVLFVAARPKEVFYFTPFRAWELLLGGLLAGRGLAPRRKASLSFVMGVLGTGLIIGPCLLYTDETTFPGLSALAPCAGACLLLRDGAHAESVVGALLRRPTLVFVGQISYSLYLWHWPCLVFARHLFGEELGVWTRLSLGGLSLLLAVLSWRFIETPFRSSRVVSDRRLVRLLVPTGGALLVGGLAAVLAHGMESRFSRDVVELDRVRGAKPARKECIRLRGALTPDNVCVLGARAHPNILIWGDSHAHALLPALDDALRHLGGAALFVSEAGCPPLPETRVAFKGQDNWRCREFNAEVAASLAHDHRIRAIVLAAAWDSYIAKDEAYRLQAAGATPGVESLRVGLNRLVENLSKLAHAPRIVLLSQVPTHTESVPLAMALSRLRGTPAPRLMEAAWNERSSASRAIFLEAASRGEIDFVDMAAWFCATGECIHAVGPRKPLYRDAGHLSSEGTAFVRPFVERALQETIRSLVGGSGDAE